MKIVKRTVSGHIGFTAKLWSAIQQVKDYSRAFDSNSVRERFKSKYNVDVFKPDLHIIAGRKIDCDAVHTFKALQRETQIRIETWDSVLDRLKQKYT